eukprot:COSAG01_NODE_2661_length_7295_cov_10.017371_4_plen_375_part_00
MRRAQLLSPRQRSYEAAEWAAQATSLSDTAPGRSMTMTSALHFAVSNGNARATRALLRAGADPQAPQASPGRVCRRRAGRGNTPLHVASEKGHAVLVELLLDAGADPNVINEQNDTPLHCGSANGHADVVTALLQGGAWFNVENNKRQVPREVAGAAFSASNRARARRQVLAAFKAFARHRSASTSGGSDDAEIDGVSAPAGSQQGVAADHDVNELSWRVQARRTWKLAASVPVGVRELIVDHHISLFRRLSELDAAHSGTLDAAELQRGIEMLGLGLTEPELERLVGAAVLGSSGEIDYRHFIEQFVHLAQTEAELRAVEADADAEVEMTRGRALSSGFSTDDAATSSLSSSDMASPVDDGTEELQGVQGLSA